MKKIAHLEQISKLVAIAVALFGILTYVYDRYSQRELQMEEHSLQTIGIYSSADMLRSKQAYFDFLKRYPELEKGFGEGKVTPNAYKNFVQMALPRDSGSKDVTQALNAIDQYYDTALFCRNSGVCEPKLLDEFMCSRVNFDLAIFDPAFNASIGLGSNPAFGESLRKYASSCNKKS